MIFSDTCSFVRLSMRNFIFLTRILILCLAAGCGSTTPATKEDSTQTATQSIQLKKCLNERTVKSVLRWGEYDPETGVFRSYQCGGDLQLKKISRESFKEQYKEENLVKIEEHNFCNVLTETVKTFEKLQTLNSSGPISRYIEYSPAPEKDSFRAVWNPRFRTFGSKEFRAIYDSLMVMVPTKDQW